MSRATSSRKEPAKSIVPAEGNFEEHPYFRVGDRNAGTGIMVYENELRTRDGNVLQQSWVVRAAHGRGLPGRYDQDVYVALLQLIDAKGLPTDGWVSFSVYELVELMGKRHSGREYQHVRESLQRLATTSIESKNAFYHRGRKAYITDTFSLLTEVKLAEYEGLAGERKDRNRVHLSQYFVDSYRANYLKNIDAKFYWSLSSPIAKRLYRLIDKKRGGSKVWEVELFSLKGRIPLSNYQYASKVKEKLAPAHEELISKRFLQGVMYRKKHGSEYVGYEITESFHARRSAVAERNPSGDEVFCAQRLQAEGMARDTAEELVAEHGTGRVNHYVDALPYQKNVRNPAGWLRKAIENGYELDVPPPATPDELGDSRALAVGEGDTDGTDGSDASMQGSSPVPRKTPDETAEDLLLTIVDDLIGTLDETSVEVWFKAVFGIEVSDGVLTLGVPSTFAQTYIDTRFRESLEASLRRVMDRDDARLALCVAEASK